MYSFLTAIPAMRHTTDQTVVYTGAACDGKHGLSFDPGGVNRGICPSEAGMKTLVVYYSLDGNTRFIASAIASAVGGDVQELKPRGEVKVTGLRKYWWGGRQVFTHAQPELEPLGVDPASYDLVFIGTPVWGWSYAPAVRSFLAGADLRGRTVALFCCHGGGKGGVFDKMRRALPQSRILGQMDWMEPLRSGTAPKAERAAQWAREMKEAAGKP